MADVDAISRAIGEKLGELRRARGLSLQTVADRAGLAKSHVWELEQGRARNPTIATAVNIAAALGVSLDFLTGMSSAEPCLHPEALRIACEIDALLRRGPVSSQIIPHPRIESIQSSQSTPQGDGQVPSQIILDPKNGEKA